MRDSEPGQPLAEVQRARILDREILSQAGYGVRLESRTADSAVVVSGRPLNETLHMTLSLFTLGLWVPVWLLVIAFGGEQRRTLRVDRAGQIVDRPGPSAHRRPLFVAAAATLFAVWVGSVSWYLGHDAARPADTAGPPAAGHPAVDPGAAFLDSLHAAGLGAGAAAGEIVEFPAKELLHAGRDTCELLNSGDSVPESAAERALLLHLRENGDGWPPEQYRAFGAKAVTYLCPEHTALIG